MGIYEGNELFYIRTDHIARPVFATNASGTVVWEASYLPFGGVQSSTGGPDLRFPGQWFQSESGLHQNWMRDYDPTLGRYLQADPLGLIDGASVYGYALQNPGRYVDPKGTCVIPTVGPEMAGCIPKNETGAGSGSGAYGAAIAAMFAAVIDWCFEDECGPHSFDGAKAIAESSAGLLALQAGGSDCITDADGETSCSCPGRPMLRAMIRHDWADDDFGDTSGSEHHKCPHWHWRNCSGAKDIVTHR